MSLRERVNRLERSVLRWQEQAQTEKARRDSVVRIIMEDPEAREVARQLYAAWRRLDDFATCDDTTRAKALERLHGRLRIVSRLLHEATVVKVQGRDRRRGGRSDD
jgi:hypothetical protein